MLALIDPLWLWLAASPGVVIGVLVVWEVLTDWRRQR
jgi:hypothetical protein